jgi:RNA polymerase sigma-70 factor, ECF subfamily
MTRPTEVTLLLARARQGESAALDALFAVVYGELRVLAQSHLRGERSGHTLSSTALVNEACMKLMGPATAGSLSDRRHFFAVASRAMRQILLDHARARLASKRGGADAVFVTLGDDQSGGEVQDEEQLIALNNALTALSRTSERLGRLVELRFFAGLNDEEIGAVLGISSRTVQRDWRAARAFLSREMLEGN